MHSTKLSALRGSQGSSLCHAKAVTNRADATGKEPKEKAQVVHCWGLSVAATLFLTR